MPSMTPLRLRIKELREARGWAQARLAGEADVRQATVSDLETGRSKGIDFSTAERLARALGVEPHQLFETSHARRDR
jgi:transcriptional regulator with XRE-family HTH domain